MKLIDADTLMRLMCQMATPEAPAIQHAVHYAEKHQVTCRTEIEKFSDMHIGSANSTDNSISIDTAPDVLNGIKVASQISLAASTYGHEIKHLAQNDAAPELFAMNALVGDIKKSLNERVYLMKDSYDIPHPDDTALRTAVIELDAEIYGLVAYAEARILDPDAQLADNHVGQGFIETCKQGFLADPDFLRQHFSRGYETHISALIGLRTIRDVFGQLPNIQPVHYSEDSFLKGTRSLWPNTYAPHVVQPIDIQRLREYLAAWRLRADNAMVPGPDAAPQSTAKPTVSAP